MLAKCREQHAFLIEHRSQACKNVVVMENDLIAENVNLFAAVSRLDIRHPCFLLALPALVYPSSSVDED